MGKAKKIYMNEPLELLAEQTKADSRRNGGFSRALGLIVNSYQILMTRSPLPEFSDGEKEVMYNIIWGSKVTASKIEGLHLDVLDYLGCGQDNELYKKIEALNIVQRVRLVNELLYGLDTSIDYEINSKEYSEITADEEEEQ